jgi:hypothetical protein
VNKNLLSVRYLASVGLAIGFAVAAQAQNNRSFVSTVGNDSNACTASAFCRTFGRALSVTNAGGEIVVEDSGGYGAATISQPVTITAIGIDASITQTVAGDYALYINTSGNVTLNGLNLYGGGSGQAGIYVNQVGFLRIYNMDIQGFTANGIHFVAPGGNLALYNSTVKDCGHDGLLVQAAGARAYVDGSDFDNNAFAGADSAEGELAIASSHAHYNQYGFFANGGSVALYGDRAIYNANGLAAGTSGKLYFADCLVTNNTNAYNISGGATMYGSSPGTSLITPGQGAVGTLSTAITLQ